MSLAGSKNVTQSISPFSFLYAYILLLSLKDVRSTALGSTSLISVLYITQCSWYSSTKITLFGLSGTQRYVPYGQPNIQEAS